jgi:hypothetical protein
MALYNYILFIILLIILIYNLQPSLYTYFIQMLTQSAVELALWLSIKPNCIKHCQMLLSFQKGEALIDSSYAHGKV